MRVEAEKLREKLECKNHVWIPKPIGCKQVEPVYNGVLLQMTFDVFSHMGMSVKACA